MNVNNPSFVVLCLCTIILTLNRPVLANKCPLKFEGFGVFLGSNDHFGRSIPGTEAKVLQIVYESLGIRLFRTSYEHQFSPSTDKYEIKCNDPYTCSWIKIQKAVSSYPDVKVFASIWSPPHYMKDDFFQLVPKYETAYLHFIRNVTAMIRQDFNIDIEKVSPVNEPENFLAPWDHTNMSPMQICRIIRNFNDPLISVCPENAWFSVTNAYYNILGCNRPCEIKATHAYAVNTDFTSSNFKLGYYDLARYKYRGTPGPIWVTEISSTYLDSDKTQMIEALDLAINIVNFVGATCVQRYYFWYAYTKGHSGESLIWGNDEGDLYLPKKFFVYKLFVSASNTTSHAAVDVSECDSKTLPCVQFGDVDTVMVNKDSSEKVLKADECTSLCCVTDKDDFICFDDAVHVPPKAVCHCALNLQPHPMRNHARIDNIKDVLPQAVKLFMINYYFKPEYRHFSKEELLKTADTIQINLTIDDIRLIAEITQDRNCWYWEKLRAGRVTSSQLKSVCEASHSAPDLSLLTRICYPEKCAPPSVHQTERVAMLSFISQMKKLHANFNYKNVGLIVDPNYPYFAATPGGSCACDCCGQCVVEVKCPFGTAKDVSIDNLLLMKDTFMEMKNGSYCLRKDHRYYYQLQMQMALCKMKFAYFYVWSPRFRITNRVRFDSTFWSEHSRQALKFAKNVLSIELMCSYFTHTY